MSKQNTVRVGPVHFQSLEDELAPVAHYLRGHMLNAGCGSRNISSYLLGTGVTEITNYDITSEDPEVIVGPLEATPFPDDNFDSVLCNAVLEHVLDAEGSIRELARVVKPGGHVVVAVPFLQPFHACPTDFRRYTADGLSDLGRAAGLDVVSVLPVHSIAQTLGWILWEYAQEKGGRSRRTAAWLAAYTATRFSNRTDRKLVRNANTFQAVFRRPTSLKPENPWRAWRERPVPAASLCVPTMLIPDELRLLNYLSEEYYSGEGAIVDAGCFLGGSTVALAEGLRRNLRKRGQPEEKLIHSYDRFQIEGWTIGSFFPTSAEAGESFRDQFDRNTATYRSLVQVHPGDVRSWPWNGGPIEILFIDIAKHWTVCDWVTKQFFPHLIPGKSVVIQQDYLYHHWVAWLHITMEFYAEYFERVCDTGVNSVAFLNTKQIPADVLREKTVESLSKAEKIELMDRAAARFSGDQARMLHAAKTHFLELLENGPEEIARTEIPFELLMNIQQGAMQYQYRGLPLQKNPFDLALYSLLLNDARPRTLIEIGSFAGGSAQWFSDQANILGIELDVLSIDLNAPKVEGAPRGVTFLQGDAHDLSATLPASLMNRIARPLMVVEDSSHMSGTTAAVLDFFDQWMQTGEYIVIEDGILSVMGVASSYDGGPLRAIESFLDTHRGRYEIDRRLCDYFAKNVTWNVDGYLRRL